MKNAKKIFFNFFIFLFLHIFCFLPLKSMPETANFCDSHNFDEKFYIYGKPKYCLNLAQYLFVFSNENLRLSINKIREIQKFYEEKKAYYKSQKTNDQADLEECRSNYYATILMLMKKINNECRLIQIEILTNLFNKPNSELEIFFPVEIIKPLKLKISKTFYLDLNIEESIVEIIDLIKK
ncbi:MAG: hypothetical protein WC436_03735 [Candidatus Babeliales bacterium]